jgi:hypothetical protein
MTPRSEERKTRGDGDAATKTGGVADRKTTDPATRFLGEFTNAYY